MEAINRSNAWLTWLRYWRHLGLRYDGFSELTASNRTELYIGQNDCQLVRNSDLKLAFKESTSAENCQDIKTACTEIRRGEEIVVSVDSSYWLARSLTLPTAALPHADKIIQFELARMTPFKLEEVYTGWVPRPTPDRDQSIEISHFTLPREFLFDALSAVEAVGGKPVGVALRSSGNIAEALSFDLNGKPFGNARFSKWSQIGATMFGVCVVTGVTFAGLLTWEQSKALETLQSAILDMQPGVGEIRKRVELLKSQAAEVSTLSLRKHANFSKIELIEEISRILPDDAFLQMMSLDGEKVVLEGNALAPEDLIGALESSVYFKDVAFAAPTFRNSGEASLRFSIEMVVETGVPRDQK